MDMSKFLLVYKMEKENKVDVSENNYFSCDLQQYGFYTAMQD